MSNLHVDENSYSPIRVYALFRFNTKSNIMYNILDKDTKRYKLKQTA